MEYQISLENYKKKNIYSLGEDFSGTSKSGEEISFTNYYMMKNGKPFFGISGELHFSRMDDDRWEDELGKMKAGGINVVSTYVFWNHHEEEEGDFDFTGCRNLRKFVMLCQKKGLYVILRVGPFDHGEVRNGGIPDWLYGKPFEVRHTNEGFLNCVRKLYSAIANQVKGLFFCEDGPIIGTQLDNEYMHSSAGWEWTTGISNEWIFGGNEGNAYMLALKELAAECGLKPVFYTCTGWGGAATPASMVPLWGGYAFQPWLFYSYSGEHPSTKEYLYQDYHNNEVKGVYNFEPQYEPETRPYSCCEMGGGMMCSYYYRFVLPYKSIDAMANIKLGSGCNFLGYYMYHGGTNPVGKHGMFLNEAQVSKISYDYQACLGEFGQVRESYRRLKTLHYFVSAYADQLCEMKTYLPEGGSEIDPKDLDTLRYAVRTDGKSGFLFLNNYQDHELTHAKKNDRVTIKMKEETIDFHSLSLAPDENCILPFHFDVEGMDLVLATAQPVTDLVIHGRKTYIFMIPEGMQARFVWGKGVLVKGAGDQGKLVSNQEMVCQDTRACDDFAENQSIGSFDVPAGCSEYWVDSTQEVSLFQVASQDTEVDILCISRSLGDKMYVLPSKGLLFTESAVYERDGGLYLEGTESKKEWACYPADLFTASGRVSKASVNSSILGFFEISVEEKLLRTEIKTVGQNRYTVSLKDELMQEGVKDVLMRIRYTGDIGHAFLDGKMISDNFCNNDIWDIGLRKYAKELKSEPVTIYITPLKQGAKVNVESTMAGRMEEVESSNGELISLELLPVYEVLIQ